VRQEANPINIAYTNAGLDLHMDLAYYESPPGIQMLHCLQNDQAVIEGGESMLLDVHHCAELLRAEDPEAFRVLCEVPATFVKDHLERVHPAQMFYRRPHFALDRASGDVAAVFWSPNFEGE
jgi:gamma-butyrobetaine dioxygenase